MLARISKRVAYDRHIKFIFSIKANTCACSGWMDGQINESEYVQVCTYSRTNENLLQEVVFGEESISFKCANGALKKAKARHTMRCARSSSLEIGRKRSSQSASRQIVDGCIDVWGVCVCDVYVYTISLDCSWYS